MSPEKRSISKARAPSSAGGEPAISVGDRFFIPGGESAAGAGFVTTAVTWDSPLASAASKIRRPSAVSSGGSPPVLSAASSGSSCIPPSFHSGQLMDRLRPGRSPRA